MAEFIYRSATACLCRVIPQVEGFTKCLLATCDGVMRLSDSGLDRLDYIAQNALAFNLLERAYGPTNPIWCDMYAHFGTYEQRQAAVVLLAERWGEGDKTAFIQDVIAGQVKLKRKLSVTKWAHKLGVSEPTLYRKQAEVRRALEKNYRDMMYSVENLLVMHGLTESNGVGY